MKRSFLLILLLILLLFYLKILHFLICAIFNEACIDDILILVNNDINIELGAKCGAKLFAGGGGEGSAASPCPPVAPPLVLVFCGQLIICTGHKLVFCGEILVVC